MERAPKDEGVISDISTVEYAPKDEGVISDISTVEYAPKDEGVISDISTVEYAPKDEGVISDSSTAERAPNDEGRLSSSRQGVKQRARGMTYTDGGAATFRFPPNNALQRTPTARAGACFVLAPRPRRR